jgi:hypothetical protein
MSDLHSAFARYAHEVATRGDDGMDFLALRHAVHLEHGMQGVYLLDRVAAEADPGDLEAAFMAGVPDMAPLGW